MKDSILFSKGKIGSLTLKNRVVMTSMETMFTEPTNTAGDRLINYYEARAKGGTGLIISELVMVDDQRGVAIPNQLSAVGLDKGPGLERLANTVHKYGTKIFFQLHHAGRAGHIMMQPAGELIGPSDGTSSFGEPVRAMTSEEVQTMIGQFIQAAKVCQIAGGDGVELHSAHGYMLSSFLSPYTNQRTDDYGGSLENRLRLITEIVMGIKGVCGPKFPVSVRMNGLDYVEEGGLTLEEGKEVARHLESIGVDVLNVSQGTYDGTRGNLEPISFPQGCKSEMIKSIKDVLDHTPVIAVNNIKKPEFAEEMLTEGVSDFIGMARQHLADPEWANKAREGRLGEITPCISCLYCVENGMAGKSLSCAVNPKLGREGEFAVTEKNGGDRTLAVIGGGPAGVTAAKTAALKGFKPVIFEERDKVGGSVLPGSTPPLKEKLQWYTEHLTYEMDRLGVEVRTGKRVSVEDVAELEPYAVFYAAGAKPFVPPIKGVDGEHVYTVMDILEKRVCLEGKKVVVVGSGMTGLETAEVLSQAGNTVSVVEMADDLAPGALIINVWDVLPRLMGAGVELLTKTMLTGIEDRFISVKHTETEEEKTIEADAVVLSIGVTPDNGMVAELEQHFDHVQVVGDAAIPGRIGNAVRDGFDKAFVLK